MKIVSDSLKNALKKPTTQRKGRILVNNEYYDVYNVEYYADVYNDGNVIGNAIASQLDFDLPYMSKFEKFKYYDGVWTGEDYEYIDMGTFTVFDEKDEDEFNKHITAFDNLINFNAPFQDIGGYPKTLFEELQNICNQANVSLKNESIANGNFEVVNNQFTSGESLKTVLKSICQLSGTYATIKEDVLVLQLKNATSEVIDKSQHEPVTWKRRTYGINQVVLGMSDIEGEYVLKQDDADIKQNGVHKLVINDNLFAYTQEKRQQLIDELFNQVRGFGYTPYEMNCEWLSYLDVGDTITIDDTETIVLRVNGKSPKALESTMSAPAIIDSSIDYVDNTNNIENRTQKAERSVDKQNLVIQDVVKQTTEQNQKISQITQTVEELNSKIDDIADITTSAEDTDAKIELTEINQSEPVRLVVRPIGENISYLYPSDNLFPSDDLFPTIRTIRFKNITTNEIVDYELPDDLLYYNSENYDEFILDYDGQSCVINKKVGYNADGSTYILDSPKTINYDFPQIILSEGDYEISVLGYDTAYIFAKLMAKNIYTTQFYTKAEVDSTISQTTQNITLSVDKKLTNYATTTEMNSAINVSASNITSSVSQTYATKDELKTTESSIKQTTDAIELSVSSKAEQEDLDKKLNSSDFTNAKIVAKINDGSSEVQIQADKIDLSGKTIDLSAQNIQIQSSNFNVDNNGNLTCSSATITGGDIEMQSSSQNPTFRLNAYRDDTDTYYHSDFIGGGLFFETRESNKQGQLKQIGTVSSSSAEYTVFDGDGSLKNSAQIGFDYYQYGNVYNNEPCLALTKNNTLVAEIGEKCAFLKNLKYETINSVSLEEKKKNFEKFENGLDVIKNVDIYKYHYKDQQDDDKKHIGFVIGDNYNYSEEITSSDNSGADLYSMISVVLQAVKEQQAIIEELQNKIKELGGK